MADDWETVDGRIPLPPGMQPEEEATVAEVVPPRIGDLNRRGSINRMSFSEGFGDVEVKPLKRVESMNYDKNHDVHMSSDKITDTSSLLSYIRRASLDSLKLISHDELGESKEEAVLSGAPLFDSTESASTLMSIFNLTEADLTKAHVRTGRKDYVEQLRDTAIKSTPPVSPFVTTRDKKLTKLAIPSREPGSPGGPTSPKSPNSAKGSPSAKRRASREGRNSRENRHSLDEPSSPGGTKKKRNSMREKQPEEATVAEVVPPRAAELFRRNSFTRKKIEEELASSANSTPSSSPIGKSTANLEDMPTTGGQLKENKLKATKVKETSVKAPPNSASDLEVADAMKTKACCDVQ